LRLRQQRVKAQQKVAQTLNQLQDAQILDKMRSQLETMTAGSQNMYLFTPSLYKMSFNAINDRLEDFLSYQDDVHQPENTEKLHAMRISGKHLRYTLEIFAPIYEQALLPYIQYMKELQDQLGEFHDADVWITWLPQFILKEQQRIIDYFGNSGPLKRLLPGFKYLIEDRQKARDLQYQAFLATWNDLQEENVWQSMIELLQTPINVEAALSHLANDAQIDRESFVEEEIEIDDKISDYEIELNLDIAPSEIEDVPPAADTSNQNKET